MDSILDSRDSNTPVSIVWQGLTIQVCGSIDVWRQKGICSIYAPGSRRFQLGYQGYFLVLRLEANDIVGSIEYPFDPLARVPAPRRFKIDGEAARPVIREGGVEWTFPGMLDELISWLRRVVDAHVAGI